MVRRLWSAVLAIVLVAGVAAPAGAEDVGAGDGGAAWVRVGGSDVSLGAGHVLPYSLWSDGVTLWVSDPVAGSVLAYDLGSGERRAGRDVDGSAVGFWMPMGIGGDGSVLWVSDLASEKVYGFDRASGALSPARTVDPGFSPRDVWSDGVTLWVADPGGGVLAAFDAATGETLEGRSLAGVVGSGTRGLWSDGTTMWVADGPAAAIRAYEVASGEARPQSGFDGLADAGNSEPAGIWSDGDTMWVLDHLQHQVFAYRMAPNTAQPPQTQHQTDQQDQQQQGQADQQDQGQQQDAEQQDQQQQGQADGQADEQQNGDEQQDQQQQQEQADQQDQADEQQDQQQQQEQADQQDQADEQQDQADEQQDQQQQGQADGQADGQQNGDDQQGEEQQQEADQADQQQAVVRAENEIGAVVVSSDAAGELTVSWEAPVLVPFEYRVSWAREDLEFLSFRFANEAHRGNEWPSGDATSVTLSGLEEGAAYKVQLRARFRDARGKVSASPWTNETTATVHSATTLLAQQQAEQRDEQDDGESSQHQGQGTQDDQDAEEPQIELSPPQIEFVEFVEQDDDEEEPVAAQQNTDDEAELAEGVLVSNLRFGNSDGPWEGYVRSGEATVGPAPQVVSFTTGSAGRYRFNGIKVRGRRGDSLCTTPDPLVTLHSNDGSAPGGVIWESADRSVPWDGGGCGTLLATLTDPSRFLPLPYCDRWSLNANVHTIVDAVFTVPSGSVILEPDTTYWLSFTIHNKDLRASGERWVVQGTKSLDQDAAEGWSIGDFRLSIWSYAWYRYQSIPAFDLLAELIEDTDE
ncbi:fibronectin type III domain-containing protein [Candidatus Poriferisodalis sp.]|uniref:fibronectin type III domain-containing protein n=1 Tax=Candidatus Poriferisodalis sp. TaxID=3101277 RepID=UPI003B01C2EC